MLVSILFSAEWYFFIKTRFKLKHQILTIKNPPTFSDKKCLDGKKVRTLQTEPHYGNFPNQSKCLMEKTQNISIDSGRFTEAHIHHEKSKCPEEHLSHFMGEIPTTVIKCFMHQYFLLQARGLFPGYFEWVTKNSYVIPWVWLGIFDDTFRLNLVLF